MENKDDYIAGRGAQIHTGNQFLQNQRGQFDHDGLDEMELKKPKTEVLQENAKSILNKVESPDLPMDYFMNPYQGCEHGCSYCYARISHEFWGYDAGLDFETKIIVKKNAAELLEKKLISKSWVPKSVMLSGNTDCYQPLERKLKITRAILKVFVKYAHPVGIITKNDLILRDIDLLQELSEKNLVHVNLSVTTLDENLRRTMEPRTSSVKNRLNAIEQLSEKGIPVNVMMAPIIPTLNSQELPEIMKSVASCGALNASYTVVRLNGQIGAIFEDWIRKNLPDRADKVLNHIKSFHGGNLNDSEFGRRMRGEGEFARSIKAMYLVAKKKYFNDKSMPPLSVNHFKGAQPNQLDLFKNF